MSSTQSSSSEKTSAADVVTVEPKPVKTAPNETTSAETILSSALRETTLNKALLSNDTSTNVSPFFAPSLTKQADILRVASHIIEHVDDFVTLTRLSTTCKLFKELVTKQKRLSNYLFDRLEEGCFAPYEMPSCQGFPGCRLVYPRDPLLANHLTSAIARYHPTFKQGNLVPCYGCRKMKKRDEFPIDQVTGHYDLHSCSSIFRRCEHCVEENKRAGKIVCGVRALGRRNESDPVVRLWRVQEVATAEDAACIRRQRGDDLEIQDLDW